MFRVALLVFLLAGQSISAQPLPAELPGPEFTARQYIDSRGCVFTRAEGADDAWQARLARDGSPICGYPPSLSARRLSPGQDIALGAAAGQKSQGKQVEQVLSELVYGSLQPGELASDPAPLQPLPDMGSEPASDGPLADLKAAISVSSQVRQEMGKGIKPNLRLCQLLGFDQGKAASSSGGGLGSDPTQGFCGSLPSTELSRLAFARPAAVPTRPADPINGAADAPKPVSGATEILAAPVATAASPKARPARAGERRARAKPATAPPRAAELRRAASAKPSVHPPLTQMRIPASARYVQVGTFRNTGNADRAAAKLGQLGLPVLRGTQGPRGDSLQLIMSGPHTSREDVVRALNIVRAAGFHDAYAR